MKLFGWWIRGEGRRAVLFFHGNAGNAADRLDRAKILRDRFGLDIFLVDYRGYGRSGGSPSEAGLARDARAIYEPRGRAVSRRSASSRSASRSAPPWPWAWPRSAPAEASCSRRRFCRSARWRAATIRSFRAFLIRTRFDNGERIPAIAAPKLFLVAEQDEVVPPEQGRRLFELAPPPKTLYVIPDARHNDTYLVGGEPYWEAVGGFLASLP